MRLIVYSLAALMSFAVGCSPADTPEVESAHQPASQLPSEVKTGVAGKGIHGDAETSAPLPSPIQWDFSNNSFGGTVHRVNPDGDVLINCEVEILETRYGLSFNRDRYIAISTSSAAKYTIPSDAVVFQLETLQLVRSWLKDREEWRVLCRVPVEAAKHLRAGDRVFAKHNPKWPHELFDNLPAIAPLRDKRHMILPDFETSTARQLVESATRLQAIMQAMVQVDRSIRRLPASAHYDKNGQPMLSWRVSLLETLGYKNLRRQFHMDEPWDSPHNMTLLDMMPDIYRDPVYASKQTRYTNYAAVVGASTAIRPARFAKRQRGTRIELQRQEPLSSLQGITDHPENTIVLGLVSPDTEIPWTKPDDIDIKAGFANDLAPAGFATPYIVGTPPMHFGVFTLADGSVRLIRGDLDVEMMRSLATVAGREDVDWKDLPSIRWPLPEKGLAPHLEFVRQGQQVVAQYIFQAVVDPPSSSNRPSPAQQEKLAPRLVAPANSPKIKYGVHEILIDGQVPVAVVALNNNTDLLAAFEYDAPTRKQPPYSGAGKKRSCGILSFQSNQWQELFDDEARVAVDMNDQRSVAVISSTSPNQRDSAIWRHGQATSFGSFPQEAAYCSATVINNDNVLAGDAHNAGKNFYVVQLFRWSNSKYELLNGATEALNHARVRDINTHGEVVGTSDSGATGRSRAWLWSGDRVSLLPIPELEIERRMDVLDVTTTLEDGSVLDRPFTSSEAMAINNRHEIAGTVQCGDEQAPVKWRLAGASYNAELMESLWLDARHSVSDMNEQGISVGSVRENYKHGSRPNFTGVLWTADGEAFNLNEVVDMEQGWEIYSANRINDRGEILVRASMSEPDPRRRSTGRWFLLRPK